MIAVILGLLLAASFIGAVYMDSKPHDDCYLCTPNCRKKRASLEAENKRLKEER